MVDQGPQFETEDNDGSTVVYGGPEGIAVGSITTSNTNVPSVADKVISGYQIQVIDGDADDLLISFDGGTTFSFVEMKRRNFRSANIKGRPTQLVLKSTSGTIADSKFEILINFEEN